MAFQGADVVEASVRDRPIPISPQKTVNIYVLVGLVRIERPRQSQGSDSRLAPYWQIITWFLIIDVMILSYLNDRGEEGRNAGLVSV